MNRYQRRESKCVKRLIEVFWELGKTSPDDPVGLRISYHCARRIHRANMRFYRDYLRGPAPRVLLGIPTIEACGGGTP